MTFIWHEMLAEIKINQKWALFADQRSRDPIWLPLLHGGTGCRAARICCWPKLQSKEGFIKDSNAVLRVKAGPTSGSSCCPVQDSNITPVCSAYPEVTSSGRKIFARLEDCLFASLTPQLVLEWGGETHS